MADIPPYGSDDCVLPFRIEGTDFRGQIVRLGASVNAVLSAHAYPPPVSGMLGEALVLAIMLGSALKFAGKLILQVQSDGPVSMLVVDYRTEGFVRGYAQVNQDKWANRFGSPGDTAKSGASQPAFGDLLGDGHFAITVDQGLKKDRYQGIVALVGDSLGDCAQAYFSQSEQVSTKIKLAIAQLIEPGAATTWRAGGLLLQSMPSSEPQSDKNDEKHDDDWRRADALLMTVEDHELLDPRLTSEKLLYRLFHEDGARVFKPKPVAFSCSCDRDSILGLLMSFPKDERREMVEPDGQIRVRCEFCSSLYAFEPESVERRLQIPSHEVKPMAAPK